MFVGDIGEQNKKCFAMKREKIATNRHAVG
jgi:hypothetical protein